MENIIVEIMQIPTETLWTIDTKILIPSIIRKAHFKINKIATGYKYNNKPTTIFKQTQTQH